LREREYLARMDAIELLAAQHRTLERLFIRVARARDSAERREAFQSLADLFAAHAMIEERIFYPQAYRAETQPLLAEAVEEHLSAKRLIADTLELEPDDEQYAAKVEVLKEQIRHHVEREERELFTRMARELLPEQRAVLGSELQSLFDRELRGDPSGKLVEQTDEAAPLP
jgi:hypothetical protein